MISPYREAGLQTYALAGVIGLVLFGWLFQRYSTARHYGVTLDRAAAIARAQTIAQELGWPVNGWEVRAWSTTTPAQLRYYLTRNPHPTVAGLFQQTRFNVNFRSPQTGQLIQVRLTGNGQLLRFSTPLAAPDDAERPGGGGGRSGGPPPGGPAPNLMRPQPKEAQPPPPEARPLAEQTIARYFPTDLSAREVETTQTRHGHDFTWKQTFPEDSRVTLTADVEISDKRVTSLAVASQFDQDFLAEMGRTDDSTSEELLRGAAVLLALLILLALALVYFDSLSRDELQQRLALRFFFGLVITLLALNLLSGYKEVLNISVGNTARWHNSLLSLLLFTLLIALLAFLAYAFWVAGHALAGRRAGRRTLAFELLFAGRFTHSYVARQLFVGLCCGVFTILPAYLLKATLFRQATFGEIDAYELFAAYSPFLMAFISASVLIVFALCVFLAPLQENYLKRPLFVSLSFVTCATLLFFDTDHFPQTPSAQFATGLLVGSVIYWVYRRHDALAATVALWSGYVIWHAAALLSQPVATLRWNGAAVLAAFVLGAALTRYFVARGEALDETLFEPLHTENTAVERERLKAEIVVAQRAQQQMLPAAPPNVPGLEIAASCQPSKDVGGDLYDFLPLPDGRLGIVVADVSGKGVPAALYMTLTKGVLAAITEHESDPGAILREANRHLYEACRKKVFVTLFLGVYDPATRVLTYARAGHNPTVYRSRTHNKLELLKPRGMGLGLSGEKLFNPALAVASLPLATDDLLFFYSDGITEAMNHKQEEYGEERLMAVAQRDGYLDARNAHDAVLADVKSFLGNVAPQDDQTLVVLRAV
jgi:serine phosphatase RsbU (regulator of sigma subunit)